MEDLKAKQQVVEKIKSSANILVTVSDNPTVDALSAAIGLTLLFEKLGKYGTAIFSGVTPPAIAFLEPEKTLDSTTDSLRDFIIALDKEKADHLRYKVEGDAVKIFITPYKTTITSEDLQFSQGDYNVELVIALGVDDQDHLDKALEAHGQIFHDAAVITITANDQTSKLGGIDWHDDKASSLSEMVTSLAESLKTDKNKSLIDGQIATAFLTGLVAQTERFSNRYTSPQSLNVASTLMASGADQQLIATKLQEAIEVPEVVEEETSETLAEEAPVDSKDDEEDGTLRIIDHNKKEASEEPTPSPKDEFVVTHEVNETLEEMDQRVKTEEQKEAAEAAYDVLKHIETPSDPRDSIEQEIEAGTESTDEPVVEEPASEEPVEKPTTPEEPATDEFIDDAPKVVTPRDPITEDPSNVVLPPPVMPASAEMEDEPSMGGTLSATAELAADDKRREEESDRNKTILSHGNGDQEAAAAASVPQIDTQAPSLMPPTPFDLGLPLPPPLPDFSVQPSATVGAYAPQPAAQPEILGDILAPEPQATSAYFTPPAASPAPNYFPPAAPAPAPIPTPMQPPIQQTPPSVSTDPGQFKIPGQQ